MHFKQMEIGKHGKKKDRQHEVEYSRNALWKWRETKNHATTWCAEEYLPTTVMLAPYILARDVVVAAA
jgi:hypothetical protein